MVPCFEKAGCSRAEAASVLVSTHHKRSQKLAKPEGSKSPLFCMPERAPVQKLAEPEVEPMSTLRHAKEGRS